VIRKEEAISQTNKTGVWNPRDSCGKNPRNLCGIQFKQHFGRKLAAWQQFNENR